MAFVTRQAPARPSGKNVTVLQDFGGLAVVVLIACLALKKMTELVTRHLASPVATLALSV